MKRMAMIALLAGVLVGDGALAADGNKQTCSLDPRSYYPARAVVLQRGGSVLIRCTVTEDGHYKDCKVLEENPKDFGFGQAATKMVCLLTAPKDADGKVIGVGETVDQHMVFNPPKRVCDKGRAIGAGRFVVDCTYVWPDEEK